MKFNKLRLLYIIFAVSVCSFIVAMIFIFVGRNERMDDQKDFQVLYQRVAIKTDDSDAVSDEPSKNTETPEKASAENESVLSPIVDIEMLNMKNPDCIGWLQIEGTTINHPVMYTPKDEQYYIDKNFTKQETKSGSLFAGAASSFDPQGDNIIIFGHNLNSDTMFSQLFAYEDEEFYNQHKTFRFDTIYGSGLYEIFAVFRAEVLEPEDDGFRYYYFYNAEDESEFNEYLDFIKTNAEYATDVEVSYGDKLLTLSTCAYHTTSGRFVVAAKKIAS